MIQSGSSTGLLVISGVTAACEMAAWYSVGVIVEVISGVVSVINSTVGVKNPLMIAFSSSSAPGVLFRFLTIVPLGILLAFSTPDPFASNSAAVLVAFFGIPSLAPAVADGDNNASIGIAKVLQASRVNPIIIRNGINLM